MLHGTGGTMKWTQAEARFNAFADRNDFVAVYPQALPPDPKLPIHFTKNPSAWEDGGPGRTGRPMCRDLAFFRTLIDALPAYMRATPERIYVTGFSNGASMCFRLAAELSDRLAAIAPIAGYCRVTKVDCPVPTLFIIGDVDPMVPPAGGSLMSPWTGESIQRPPIDDTLNHWAKLIGCTSPRQLQQEAEGIREERYPGPVEFTVMTVAGLGHHWPGGRGQLKRSLAGPWSNRLDANATIWEFFNRTRHGG